jgi:hypothetical protein
VEGHVVLDPLSVSVSVSVCVYSEVRFVVERREKVIGKSFPRPNTMDGASSVAFVVPSRVGSRCRTDGRTDEWRTTTVTTKVTMERRW